MFNRSLFGLVVVVVFFVLVFLVLVVLVIVFLVFVVLVVVLIWEERKLEVLLRSLGTKKKEAYLRRDSVLSMTGQSWVGQLWDSTRKQCVYNL